MIQVLKRSAEILEYLEENRNAGIQEVADAVNIKFTTACNIFRTLIDLGWIAKHDRHYQIGPALIAFAEGDIRRSALALIAEQSAQALSREINEGVVISLLSHGEKFTLAKVAPDREITVNEKRVGQVSPFATADGRILLAWADVRTLDKVISRYGLPGKFWNSLTTRSALVRELSSIRSAGSCIRSAPESEICGLAVPVFRDEVRLWGALGVYLPRSRFEAARVGIFKAMKTASYKMSQLLSGHEDSQ